MSATAKGPGAELLLAPGCAAMRAAKGDDDSRPSILLCFSIPSYRRLIPPLPLVTVANGSICPLPRDYLQHY